MASKKKVARVPGSVTARIETLAIGVSLAEAARFELDRDTLLIAQKWLDKAVRALSVNVDRVKKSRSGRNYRVERMTEFSRDGALLCAVVVTRTA